MDFWGAFTKDETDDVATATVGFKTRLDSSKSNAE